MADPYAGIGAADPYAAVAAPAPAPVAAKPPPSTLEDVARSAWGGLLSGIAGASDMVNPAVVGPAAVKFGLSLTNPKAAAAMAKAPVQPSGTTSVAPVGGSYVPRTTTGRYTHAIAAMLPNAALGPEGLIPKAASVVLPAVFGQGASDATAALGGDQNAQALTNFAASVAGGGAAGFAGAARRAAPQILTDAEKPAASAIQAALDMTGAHRDDVKAITSTGTLPAAASPGLTQLADAVTTQPGTGQTLIRDAVGQRFASQGQRALQAVQTHLGVDPAAAHGDVDSIVKQGQLAVGPQYDALRANPAPVMTPRLAVLAQTPAVKKAINLTVTDMLNNPDGPSPTTVGFKMDPDTGNWSLPANGSFEGISEQQPTAATWIGVHQNMGQTVDRSPLTNAPLPNAVSPGNRNIESLSGKLGDELRTAIPGYGDALDQSGDYLSTRSAFNRASGKLFSGPVYDFQQMWGSLKNPAEQKAAQAAIANDILTKSEGKSVLPGMFKSPGVQQKMQIAFPQGGQDFLGQMEDDVAERDALGGVIGGPPSAKRLIAQMAASQTKPVGPVRKFAQTLTGAVDNIASFTHPLTATTKIARMVAGTNAPTTTIPPPWEDPQTNARLGQLLSDPRQMSAFLDRMAAQRSADYTASRGGLLSSGPRLALPGLLSGLAAPSAAQAGQGQPSP